MSNKATKYMALIDGLLALAARDLSAQEYAELRGGLSALGWNSDECPSSRENPCIFPRWHHGPHSWEKATDSDALVERYRRTHPEGKVTVGEALAAMQKQNANPPACGFRSLREDARAYADAKVRTGPMCKATKGTGSGYDICWREEGHREDHDLRPGVVASGAPAQEEQHATTRDSIASVLASFDVALKSQGGRCAICKTTDPGSKGWMAERTHYGYAMKLPMTILCPDCTLVLTAAKDSATTLQAALKHVMREVST